MEFRVTKELWSDSIAIYARTQINGEWKAVVCDGLKLVDLKQGEFAPKLLNFAMLDAGGQSLFDALWQAGFRPNSGESSQAHVEAMKYHLEDMRSLVLKK